MELILEIVSDQQFADNTVVSKEFKSAGGVIGRAPDCDWIIADPKRYVSGHHALISTKNNQFYITDTSSNGTILKNTGSKLPAGEPFLIEHGAVFSMGDYDIRARLVYDPEVFENVVGKPVEAGSIIPDDAFLDLDPIKAIEQQPFQYVDMDELADFMKANDQQDGEQRKDYARVDIESLEIPQLVEDKMPEPVKSVPTPAYVPPPATPTNFSSDFWDKFAAELGIDIAKLDETEREQLAIHTAKLFKQCIAGIQQSLRTRSDLKNELRLPITTVQATGNNPLRYTVDAESAINDLLKKHNPNQLTPEQAINRAFRDLQAHQVALLAACRGAVRTVIHQFSPAQLILAFEQRGDKGVIKGSAWKWRTYCRYHNLLQQDAEWSDRLFSKDFTTYYEEQVRLLASLNDD
ncbi:type VI secretion system-associated FHA domain protein TagH [Entomomonas asaccharolytica]|uniref:Type VI secretion system-associated FHA domain protein TagH n=1 Tax=Entomomonas asaccharolytica TaxID=2785331 RepID=A0A974RYL4_9GAMM|nr:type VI secretion system-associated FHA domain protein TagH [Entomomonas asaccharolytica]QQP86014.1 type VI secretion system-associated FHA domain protein TagH [Entomomonas asaccharolytica]